MSRGDWPLALLVVLVLVSSGCVVMTRSERDRIDAQQARTTADLALARQKEAAALAEVSDLEDEVDRLNRDLDEARSQTRELRRQTSELEATLGAISAELDLAVSNYQQVLVTYEEEIRAAQQRLHETMSERLCDLQFENPSRRVDVREAVDEIIAASPDIQATLVELPPILFVDLEALVEVRDDCYLQANLLTPKQDGFYLVGVEIAPGLWRSAGGAQACYWARRDSDQHIIDSYFGRAGGTITIQPSDFEVQFDGCGVVAPLGL